MIRSTLQGWNEAGLHVAIIMDGSGRWARRRGLSRTEGHRAGTAAVRRVVEAAPSLGVTTLTLHAFSSDNWQRPARESANLMQIFEHYLRTDVRAWVRQGTRVKVIGRRDRLPAALLAAIEAAESTTYNGRGLRLFLGIDYSSRQAITRVAWKLAAAGESSSEAFARTLAQDVYGSTTVPEVDLLIRSGGEQRLSDFFLWECAYAELVFTPRLWPDFDASDLEAAIKEFQSRDRRFGGLPEAIAV